MESTGFIWSLGVPIATQRGEAHGLRPVRLELRCILPIKVSSPVWEVLEGCGACDEEEEELRSAIGTRRGGTCACFIATLSPLETPKDIHAGKVAAFPRPLPVTVRL